MSYDARGRLIQSIDAAGGTTQIAYDLADRPIRVSDPRNLVTTYEFDGFGQMWKQVSRIRERHSTSTMLQVCGHRRRGPMAASSPSATTVWDE